MGRRTGLVAAVGGVAAFAAVWHRKVTPWHQCWGATREEAEASLPGDELVAEPASQVTRGIGIDAPPEAVWPWVAQLGADRGGFYSYEWLENLFGLGIRNSDVIVLEWQDRAVGDLVSADAKGSGGWYVARVVPGEALVLQMGDVSKGRPTRRDEGVGMEFLWTFVVRPAPGGGSRLLVRERTAFGNPWTARALSPVGLVSFVMTRRMLLGIRDRAETTARLGRDRGRAVAPG
jgi:hypothetical protein